MSIRTGFYRMGNCWTMFQIPYRTTYSGGEYVVWTWWRFYIVLDRRFA